MKVKIIVFLVIVLVLNSCVATFKVGSKTYSNKLINASCERR